MPVTTMSSLRQRIALAAVVAAPVLAVVGSGLQPKDSSHDAVQLARFDAHPDKAYVGYLVAAIGFWLFLPAATSLAQLFRHRGSRVGPAACMVMAVGAVAFGAGSLLEGTALKLLDSTGIDHASALAFVHAANKDAVAGLPWMIGMLMMLGFLAIAVTLLYARDLPWWQPALLIVGVVGVFAGGQGTTSIFLGLPIIAAFASLAWSISRLDATGADSATVDLVAAVPAQSVAVDTPARTRSKA
jgi:hypothetical protein